MNRDIGHLRERYEKGILTESDAPDHPMILFNRWFEEACASDNPEPNAIALATSTLDGKPSVRIVLVKSYDHEGLVFYTNYLSLKGKQLNTNPYASGTMWWPTLQRQVRISGRVTRISRSASKKYFDVRPLKSRMGAIVSSQSSVIPDRDVLEKEMQYLEDHPEAVQIPDHWGGYRIMPQEMEFWQGRRSRLHDRLRYKNTGDGWVIDRLAP